MARSDLGVGGFILLTHPDHSPLQEKPGLELKQEQRHEPWRKTARIQIICPGVGPPTTA